MAKVHTDTTIGYADRQYINLIFLAPIPGAEERLVVKVISHSMRDPAAWRGPSHRPDFGRSYKGAPKEE